MFRPHYGICICHGQHRLIVVKAGYCKEGNETRKRKHDGSRMDGLPNRYRNSARTSKAVFRPLVQQPKKKKPILYRRKRTGEGEVFQKIIERVRKMAESPWCECCRKAVHSIGPANFSHALSKGAYPSLRLDERNIWFVCETCHHEWEFGDKSQPKFEAKRQRAAELKLEYYTKSK